jgi:predicted RNA-binding Zn ribbon-like protein
VFDLDGGKLCLNFANTLASSGEHLNSYTNLVAFALQSGLLTPQQANGLHAAAGRDPAAAEQVLGDARRLRGAVRGIFFAVAADETPRATDFDVLNSALAASLGHACVVPDSAGAGYVWGWSAGGPEDARLDAPLWPVARSAADLLTSDQERRLVRECGAATCAWLFIDSTRNRSRQWCSMSSCGNREKARRHYQRQRARSESTDDVTVRSGAANGDAAGTAQGPTT